MCEKTSTEKLRQKCELLERRCAKYKSDYNALAQYGHRNKLVLSGISDSVSKFAKRICRSKRS